MKKLILLVAVATTVMFASCGKKACNQEESACQAETEEVINLEDGEEIVEVEEAEEAAE